MKVIIVLLFSLCIHSLGAQNRSFATLTIVNNPKPGNSGFVPFDSSKYRKAERIFNKLVNARGDFRYPVPSFTMTATDEWVAFMDYASMEIGIEAKAYKVCESMGDQAESAIAFLLGHELSHYYEKHAWKKGFAKEFRDLPIGMKIDSLQEDISNETEADYLGGFLCYSAGFGIFDQAGELMQRLYKEYKLPEKMKKYPSLSDRQLMSKRTGEKLRRLVYVFDLANLLTVTGNYSEAYKYYKYILMQYQSREIYNNLGTTSLLDALQYISEKELKFKYPIQLDLSASQKDGFSNVADKLIRQAILHFDAAINLDPDYAPAYLNKACAYALLGDKVRARFYGDVETRAVAGKNQDSASLTKISVLMGILEAQEGNVDAAARLFEKASNEGNKLAGLNLKILKGDPIGLEKEAVSGLKKEKIDNQNLKSMMLENQFSNLRTIPIESGVNCNYVESQGPSSFLFVSENELTEVNWYFHGTKPGYSGSTARNIKIGADHSAIVSAYGEPGRTIETPLGTILAYRSIIFILNNDNKLDRWIVYEKS
jgi:tetratricopeptide (TPR) repeat protein